jgi:hypothetical protein
MTMTQERAEVIGITAASWLASHEELLPLFLGATGASQDDFREGIENADFLGSVLDFILMDDAWIAELAGAAGLPMNAPYEARMALPGGAQVHWT